MSKIQIITSILENIVSTICKIGCFFLGVAEFYCTFMQK